MAACPYPFNGTFLLGLKKETLMTKGHWEEVEILMADNAVTAILTARDRYVDAWLALHEDDGPDVAESAPPLVYQDETAPDLGPQHSYDGKQVGMWSSGDVAEWLKSLGALSDEEKGQVKDKFRAIKADEEEGVDHKFNMHNAPFNGVDLHFVKEKHLTNPGTTKKTALVEGLARRLIEARDAIVKVTDYIDTANSLSLDDPEALAKHFTGRPMWDWVHSNVQEFFLSMELKRDVKKALSYQLSDWVSAFHSRSRPTPAPCCCPQSRRVTPCTRPAAPPALAAVLARARLDSATAAVRRRTADDLASREGHGHDLRATDDDERAGLAQALQWRLLGRPRSEEGRRHVPGVETLPQERKRGVQEGSPARHSAVG